MSAAGKSLIILTPGFPANETDSTCLPWMQNIMRNLKTAHPELTITVISFQYPHTTTEYCWEGIKVIPLGGANKGGLSKFLLRSRACKKLDRIHKQRRVTGILSFWYGECARTGHLFARRKSVRHACWIAGQDAKKNNRFPERLKIPGSDLIAGSDFIRKFFFENHAVIPEHIMVPGTDASLFGNDIDEKDIDLLGAGSLIPLKQYEIFLKTVKAIHEKKKGIKAVLIGKGPEEEKLKQQINKYGLEKVVTLTGELSYNDTLKHMQRTKVFLHPSAYEGFGCVCTEALCAGARVVRFTNPMNTPMKNTISVNTAKQMTEAAIGLLNENKQYESVNEFPIEITVNKLAALFGL